MLAELLIAIPDDVFTSLHYMDELVAVAGGVLLGVGLAGVRAGWSPRCRRCKFDLRGVAEGAAVCPECGASLSRRSAVVYGARSRRWGLVALGVVIVCSSAASTLFNVPGQVISWREQVIEDSFDLNATVELAVQGNQRATSDLLRALSGSSRRFGVRAGSRNNQEAITAVLDRIETDPAAGAVLLPLIVGGPARGHMMMWVRDSILPVRLAKILCQLAEESPASLAALNLTTLSMIFQSPNGAATTQLLSSPAMVAYLYSGHGMTDVRLRDDASAVTIRITPTFGGSQGNIWLHQLPVALAVTEARWRMKGDSESAWQPAFAATRVPMSASAEISLNGAPERGILELVVRGMVVQGLDAEVMRRAFNLRDTRADGAPVVGEGSTATPFEWRQFVNIKPRSELVLTPTPTVGVGNWVEDAFMRTSIVPLPAQGKDAYQVLCDLAGNINGILVQVKWTLEQDGRTWQATFDRARRTDTTVVQAPGFDPAKPFTLHAEPNLEILRRDATEDSRYLDLRQTLRFDAAVRTPREITDRK